MIFEFIRSLTCPFEEIEKYTPQKGKILDVGCGHGIFSFILAKNKNRQVLGIDPSSRKINIAQGKPRPKNLKFQKDYIGDIQGKFTGVCIIDVAYLLPTKKKLEMFKKAYSVLNKRGKIILVETGAGTSFMYKILSLQETIMTGILKSTYTDFKRRYFLEERKYIILLTKTGFKIETERKLKSLLPYPHFLLVGTKT